MGGHPQSTRLTTDYTNRVRIRLIGHLHAVVVDVTHLLSHLGIHSDVLVAPASTESANDGFADKAQVLGGHGDCDCCCCWCVAHIPILPLSRPITRILYLGQQATVEVLILGSCGFKAGYDQCPAKESAVLF